MQPFQLMDSNNPNIVITKYIQPRAILVFALSICILAMACIGLYEVYDLPDQYTLEKSKTSCFYLDTGKHDLQFTLTTPAWLCGSDEKQRETRTTVYVAPIIAIILSAPLVIWGSLYFLCFDWCTYCITPTYYLQSHLQPPLPLQPIN